MDLGEQRFRIRWSWLTWVVTIGVSLVVIVVAVVLLRAAMHSGSAGGPGRVMLAVAAFVPVVIFGIVALFAPLAIDLRPDVLVVRRLVRDVVIPLGQIREIRRMEPRDARFVWRLCGSGGFLGFFGLFYSRALGDFWAYAGNREDLVLLMQTDGTKIVISPYPPDAFVETVQGQKDKLGE
jgi:hypothetical protein